MSDVLMCCPCCLRRRNWDTLACRQLFCWALAHLKAGVGRRVHLGREAPLALVPRWAGCEAEDLVVAHPLEIVFRGRARRRPTRGRAAVENGRAAFGAPPCRMRGGARRGIRVGVPWRRRRRRAPRQAPPLPRACCRQPRGVAVAYLETARAGAAGNGVTLCPWLGGWTYGWAGD